MEPLSITVLVYVSAKFVDQFITDEGYGRLRKFLFPVKSYQTKLVAIIYATINEFESGKSIDKNSDKIPFYHSQILFAELNKYTLFKNSPADYNAVISLFETNPNIIIPSTIEIISFYEIFTEKVKNDNQLKKLFIEENFKAKIFSLGEAVSRVERKIDTISSKVEAIYSQMSFEPDQRWFNEQAQSSIIDLGKRYTPDLNVNLHVSKIFEGLGRTEDFKKNVTKQFDKLLLKGKQLLKGRPEVDGNLKSLELALDGIDKLFHKTDFLGTALIPISEFDQLHHIIYKDVQEIYNYYITEERKIQKEKNDYNYFHEYGYELRNIREFEAELKTFKSSLRSSLFQLANNPFLLLDGEAGIGKSHLIADIVSRRIQNGHESVFLLGQHFVTEEDPWTQIFKRLQINSKAEDLLKKLNGRAAESGKRIIIFIDAVNEGKGNYFWSEYIKSFIDEIKKYSWLGLVLTVRSSYKKIIFPEEEISGLGIVEHPHYGFRNIEYEASRLFFDNYKIALPNVPLLHPEFQNPLFLKLFCDGINKAGLTRIPDGLQGISSIINFFVKNVNFVLSKPKRVGYSDSLNLVQKSIYALIKCKVDNQFNYIPYEMAHRVVNDSIASFIDKKAFIDELITEGVLSKNLFWKEDNTYEEGVYLAYERFEDHLTVQYLLEQSTDLTAEFQKGGRLYNFVRSESEIYSNKGLVEAFSIQVPEKKGYEFYTLLPKLKYKYPVVESFVESLLWRKFDTINKESEEYVNKHVFSFIGTHDLFWETILAATGIPDHYYNARFLHNHLMNFSLAERDAEWTQFLKNRYTDDSSVKRLIDWAWNPTDKSHISDESLLLSCIALVWFHTSTNRKLRDCSTKALVSLLEERLDVLLQILKLFEQVNDPYVYERLFAVAYGCVVRTNHKNKIKEVCEYVFNIIFNNPKGVIPHILLRDYARGIIEYADYLDIGLSFELTKVRPPYDSKWPENIPSLEDLEQKYDNEKYRHIWSSVMGFGDFSRYTIGTNSNMSEWSGCKFGEIAIDRRQVFKDFKGRLSAKQLKLLKKLNPIITKDPEDGFMIGDGEIKFKIAVGRKTEEELEEIRNDFKKSVAGELLIEYEREIEPFLDHNQKIINTGEHFDLRISQRLILSRAIELGWDPELHLSFDKEIGTGRGRQTKPHDRIGKKYQWIAYYEYMALLADNFIMPERLGNETEKAYEGPWDPYDRDIDPTMLISETGTYDDEESEGFWWGSKKKFDWSGTNQAWVNDDSALPPMEDIIQITDDKNQQWLILEGYPSWSEQKKIGEEKWEQPHKELWYQVRSYLVKDEEYSAFKNWAVQQDFEGRWMPESSSRYEMFSREYYWSPAQRHFTSEYYGGGEWRKVYDKNSGNYVAQVNVTTVSFLWEAEGDHSKDQTISFLKPSTVLYNGMDLKYSKKEGEFVNNRNELECFAANVHHNSKSYLLVRKDSFLKFLEENNLKIVWTVLGEKQVIGGHSFRREYPGRLEICGTYYFEDLVFTGNLRTRKI
ncbi:hypothetical protein HNP37_004670 [Flavobacterium nitrogenifigens]|uniref:ATP-binding protein n=2 Tax=Flavobacterium TaxID=237 RepID=A0A7W7N966_9FLAO|nr:MULTISPECIES: AVAST type 2 anti-phage system protein Avs2 [Flavobacterium]MBB4804573.1 hypothetical protein [Flavobacterium nitrogenifigens]MBB6389532.1 hypothetical protein [Flavobacterium notoginsengisoli]